MGHFQKKVKTKQAIPTASLPDIIFMLLIFFMVSTVLRETTVMVRTTLPHAEALTKIEQKRLVSFVYVGPRRLEGGRYGPTTIQIDDALVQDVTDVRTIMYNKLMDNPRLIVSLRVDQESEMGIVTDVQQEFREAGTLRINYSSRRATPAGT
jgi:biopolymer transport protein ExbD